LQEEIYDNVGADEDAVAKAAEAAADADVQK
jgi:hypothetical protein